jgi:hypothetical protein
MAEKNTREDFESERRVLTRAPLPDRPDHDDRPTPKPREAGLSSLVHRAATDLDRVSPDEFGHLQSALGNRAVGRLVDQAIQRQQVQRGPGPATAKPRKPTIDEIAREIGPTLGGPYADYAAFAATMVTGSFLGHPIDRGVRPEFLAKLQTAKTKIDAEFTASGNPVPAGYGISSVGGFRWAGGPHGWGLAIDLDVARNPFVMHEHNEAVLDTQLGPVYHRIAETMLNAPIGGEQSIIPKIITSGKTMAGGTAPRRDRLAEYYDRLALESKAMQDYFALMKDPDPNAIANFLAGPWLKTHPGGTAPAVDDVRRHMWEDFATLGGSVPTGGPPGVPGFHAPGAIPSGSDRPFAPNSAPVQDPAAGFLTIPREVVLGLGQIVTRWGAIDFGGESGDIQHFDDMGGLGGAIAAATSAAQAKIVAAATAAGPTSMAETPETNAAPDESEVTV